MIPFKYYLPLKEIKQPKVKKNNRMTIKLVSGHPLFNENMHMMNLKLRIPIESKSFDPQPGDLYVVWGAHEIAPMLWATQKNMNNKIGYVIMHSEQLASTHMSNKYYIRLCQDNPTVNYSQYLAEQMYEKFDIREYGYFYFDFVPCKPVELKKYDIVFVGTRNPMREAFEGLLRAMVPDARIHFEYDSIDKGPQHLSELYVQSKIVLNLPFYEGGALETHRINKALACGAIVVSVGSGDPYANKFYSDYVHFCEQDTHMLDFLKEKWRTIEPKKTWLQYNQVLAPSLYSYLNATIVDVHDKMLTKLGMQPVKVEEGAEEVNI